MKIFGLIGRKLAHSFSPQYFRQKFSNEKINDAQYRLYPLENIHEFHLLIKNNPDIAGLNVTIPYKTDIIPLLDGLSKAAKEIGAVNTIKIEFSGTDLQLIGYNTDYLGFTKSIEPHLKSYHTKALILGTGGSSKAVKFGLKQLNIDFMEVSRNPQNQNQNQMNYSALSKEVLNKYKLIINTTPLGMFPEVNKKPDIDYSFLTRQHLLYDLIYNPYKTMFLKEGEKNGCQIKNGLEMLQIQAEYSWKIWNDNF